MSITLFMSLGLLKQGHWDGLDTVILNGVLNKKCLSQMWYRHM